MKVLIIAHGHPTINVGGGEKAAYILFNRFRVTPGVQAYFLGRAEEISEKNWTHISAYPGKRNEYFLHTSMADYFNMSSVRPEKVAAFTEFLQAINPDVIHFHHYIHLGIELIQVARSVCPDAKVAITLHEYIALCNRDGQMIKTGGDKLCYESNPLDCSMCFPKKSPGDFFLRENYIKLFLKKADAFVVPSRFLMQRYVNWGLPEDRMVFIPYGAELELLKPKSETPLSNDERCNVFGFFGQINNYKGVDVLVSAVEHMSKAERKQIQVEIFGNLSAGLSPERREYIESAFKKYSSTIRFNGPYQSVDMARLIRRVDWVVTPSIWWENAPLVIDEAFASRKPVLCSNIGGMAEKVRDGIDGVHFDVGNHRALARKMLELAKDSAFYQTLKSNIAPPYDVSVIADRHIKLYGAIRSKDIKLSDLSMDGQSDYAKVSKNHTERPQALTQDL